MMHCNATQNVLRPKVGIGVLIFKNGRDLKPIFMIRSCSTSVLKLECSINMGRIIKMNDTLQISKKQGFPTALYLEAV